MFSIKSFCLTVAKASIGESFTVALSSCSEKVWIRGGGVSRFSVEFLLSHSAEILGRGIPHCYSNFGFRNCRDKKGGIKIFHRDFLSHIAENSRRGFLYCCIKFL